MPGEESALHTISASDPVLGTFMWDGPQKIGDLLNLYPPDYRALLFEAITKLIMQLLALCLKIMLLRPHQASDFAEKILAIQKTIKILSEEIS